MKLRGSPSSPFVRKVAAAAIECGLDGRIENVPVDVWAADTDQGEINPLGKVPALITDDGEVLFDSPVVCEYLDSLHDGDKLFPAAGPARWQTLKQQALADGILDAAVSRLLEGRRPEAQRSADWMERQRRVVERALDSFETDAAALDGPPTIGRLTAAVALGYLDFRFAGDDWRAARPKLAAWYKDFAERPSMQATVPQDAT